LSVSEVILTGVIFLVAMLYSSVGHGGASGYLAVMGLAGVSAAVMRPAALVLNVLVSGLTAWRFHRAGHFRWATIWPFAAASVPMAAIGGYWKLPGVWYQTVLGAVLLYSAARMVLTTHVGTPEPTARVPTGPAMAVGGGIGLLSGLTGVGGGIFLSPLLLFLRWAELRQTAATSAAFILVNSLSGLAGLFLKGDVHLPAAMWGWIASAGIGGMVGSRLGSGRLRIVTIKRLLAAVLLMAGGKMLLDAGRGLFVRETPRAAANTRVG